VRSKNDIDVPALFSAIKDNCNAISVTITNEMNM